MIRLPSQPLVEAITASRTPLSQLLPDDADRRALHRARAAGTVSEAVADRLAIRALGLTLELIYDPDVLEGAPA